MGTNRLKRIAISHQLFLMMFTQGDHPAYRVIAEGVPEDAKFVNVQHAWPHCLEVLIESESFPEVPDGELIPYLTPMMEELGH